MTKVAGIELAAAATTDTTGGDYATIRTTSAPGAAATNLATAAPAPATPAPAPAPACRGGGGRGGGAAARRQPSTSVAAAPSGGGGADNASATDEAAVMNIKHPCNPKSVLSYIPAAILLQGGLLDFKKDEISQI